MSTLAIVTFTDGTRPTQLAQCTASISADLPTGATHHVIQVRGLAFYAQQRVEAMSLADYVCFVDDDDTVTNGGITKTFAAIQSGNYGYAFTDEALVDSTGNVLSTRTGTRTYEQMIKQPWMFHHLSMYKSSIFSGMDLSYLNGRINGVNFRLSLIAADVGGAIHVPTVGYNWTQASDTLSHRSAILPINVYTMTKTGTIPTYTG